jgi:membrane protein implicated in regulation of membrane protease activity
MTQTRLGSLIEALINIVIGYVVAIASQLAIFPLFGIHIALSTNLWIGLWFTVVSLVRSYIIRRWFNARLHRAAEALAATVHEEHNCRTDPAEAFEACRNCGRPVQVEHVDIFHVGKCKHCGAEFDSVCPAHEK